VIRIALLLLVALAGCSGSPPQAAGNQLAFVANSQDNTVSAIDLGRLKTAATIPVAQEPVALAVTDRVWVVCKRAGLVQVLDPSTLGVVGAIQTGREPFSIITAGARAWVPNRGSRSITVLDLRLARASGTISLDAAPGPLEVSPDVAPDVAPDRRLLAVSLPGRKEVVLIDTERNSTVGRVALPAAPSALQFRADGKQLFVALPELGQIAVLDSEHLHLVVRIQVGRGVGFFAPKPDGGEIYSLDTGANGVSIVTAYNDEVSLTMPAGVQPWHGLVDPTGSMLFVANNGSNNVSMMDIDNRKTLAAVPAGNGPVKLALSPDGSYLLAANSHSNDVTVIRTAARALLTVIPVGRGPADIVTMIAPDAKRK
jgi:YVTN family beta-propeller protein